MSRKQKFALATAFWSSGATLVAGVLLLNFSIPISLIIVGVLGLAFTLGWFIEVTKE